MQFKRLAVIASLLLGLNVANGQDVIKPVSKSAVSKQIIPKQAAGSDSTKPVELKGMIVTGLAEEEQTKYDISSQMQLSTTNLHSGKKYNNLLYQNAGLQSQAPGFLPLVNINNIDVTKYGSFVIDGITIYGDPFYSYGLQSKFEGPFFSAPEALSTGYSVKYTGLGVIKADLKNLEGKIEALHAPLNNSALANYSFKDGSLGIYYENIGPVGYIKNNWEETKMYPEAYSLQTVASFGNPIYTFGKFKAAAFMWKNSDNINGEAQDAEFDITQKSKHNLFIIDWNRMFTKTIIGDFILHAKFGKEYWTHEANQNISDASKINHAENNIGLGINSETSILQFENAHNVIGLEYKKITDDRSNEFLTNEDFFNDVYSKYMKMTDDGFDRMKNELIHFDDKNPNLDSLNLEFSGADSIGRYYLLADSIRRYYTEIDSIGRYYTGEDSLRTYLSSHDTTKIYIAEFDSLKKYLPKIDAAHDALKDSINSIYSEYKDMPQKEKARKILEFMDRSEKKYIEALKKLRDVDSITVYDPVSKKDTTIAVDLDKYLTEFVDPSESKDYQAYKKKLQAMLEDKNYSDNNSIFITNLYWEGNIPINSNTTSNTLIEPSVGLNKIGYKGTSQISLSASFKLTQKLDDLSLTAYVSKNKAAFERNNLNSALRSQMLNGIDSKIWSINAAYHFGLELLEDIKIEYLQKYFNKTNTDYDAYSKEIDFTIRNISNLAYQLTVAVGSAKDRDTPKKTYQPMRGSIDKTVNFLIAWNALAGLNITSNLRWHDGFFTNQTVNGDFEKSKEAIYLDIGTTYSRIFGPMIVEAGFSCTNVLAIKPLFGRENEVYRIVVQNPLTKEMEVKNFNAFALPNYQLRIKYNLPQTF